MGVREGGRRCEDMGCGRMQGSERVRRARKQTGNNVCSGIGVMNGEEECESVREIAAAHLHPPALPVLGLASWPTQQLAHDQRNGTTR